MLDEADEKNEGRTEELSIWIKDFVKQTRNVLNLIKNSISFNVIKCLVFGIYLVYIWYRESYYYYFF